MVFPFSLLRRSCGKLGESYAAFFVFREKDGNKERAWHMFSESRNREKRIFRGKVTIIFSHSQNPWLFPQPEFSISQSGFSTSHPMISCSLPDQETIGFLSRACAHPDNRLNFHCFRFSAYPIDNPLITIGSKWKEKVCSVFIFLKMSGLCRFFASAR